MNWSRLLSTTRAGPSDHPAGDRTEFEDDLGRVVFSTPVRRLQDKTHVFPLEAHDSVRTRLTHSLEVSSVARDLSQAACRRLADRIPPQYSHAVSTIAAACALLHDVGNPPFGHAGEKAIQDWFIRKLTGNRALAAVFASADNGAQDFIQFDGNAQMVRLATRLQVLSDSNGMNLTFGTLSAACKYVVSAQDTRPEPHERSKPGFFETERELICRVQEETGTGVARNPITYLVEAADDIVNVCIDLEDGVRKRVFRWQEMIEELERCGAGGAAIALKNEAQTLLGKRGLAGYGAGDVFAQAFRGNLMLRLIPAALDEFQASYDAIMTGEYGYELVKRSRLGGLYTACKEVVKRHIFCSPEVLRLEIMGRRVIQDLLDLYWEGVGQGSGAAELRDEKGFSNKLYSIISDNYRNAFEQDLNRAFPTIDPAATRLYLQLRLVCDQVAGMTDAYAVGQHRLLLNS
jgi:dGTPase